MVFLRRNTRDMSITMVETPRSLTLLLIITLTPLCHTLTDPTDLKVLNEFRQNLDNPNLLKWPETSDDPCGPPSWPHVICSGDRVSQIQAQNLGLEGTLPRSFNNLSKLTNLGLQGNKFRGQLPSFRGLLELEFAYLDNNELDSIPNDFFIGLSSVRVLALDRNPFNATTGWSIPEDLSDSPQLTNLSLVACNLVGPIPEFLGAMPSLTVLKLSYNRLSGEIPASFDQSLVQILWLNDQDGDGIGGRIDVVASMTMLTQAWLHGNRFSGQIPATIANLPSLKELNLNGNNLVGMIPQSLADMELHKLDLSNNLLSGPIPDFKSSNVTVASNYFCHDEPGVPCSEPVSALLEFLGKLNFPERLVKEWYGDDPCDEPWTGLSCGVNSQVLIINLPRRGLNGTLSDSLASLSSLMEIRLPGNNITGAIPENFTRLEHLRMLDLSGNNLDPPLPSFREDVKVVIDRNPLLLSPQKPLHSPSISPPFLTDFVPASPVGTTNLDESEPRRSNKTKRVTIIVAAICSVSALALILSPLSIFLFVKRRKKMVQNSSIVIHPSDSSDPENAVKIAVSSNYNAASGSISSGWTESSRQFEASGLLISVQVLHKATAGFAAENELGRGGFGTVYKGELEDGTRIAVKRMESVAALGSKAFEEFEAEVAVLSRVRHRHLVSLLGYTIEGNERLLVYDYLPQGALSRHLFHWKSLKLQPLSWTNRLIIALDVARGIEYLHGLARQTFIHRDLKSSNILLGNDFRAKVADFGLVKLAPDGGNSVATKLAGTFGYLAPEYAVMGKITTKADVFSFGVVLMELITGLTALDESRSEESRYLANWFWKIKSNKDKLMSAIDPTLGSEADEKSITIIAELAGHCTAREPSHRPDMGHVVSVLSQLVEQWKPAADELDIMAGIDYGLPLPQQLKEWQEIDSRGDSCRGSDASNYLNDSKGSIPARPMGFADSLTSTDAR